MEHGLGGSWLSEQGLLGQWDLLVEWDVGFLLDSSLMCQFNEFAMFCGYIAPLE